MIRFLLGCCVCPRRVCSTPRQSFWLPHACLLDYPLIIVALRESSARSRVNVILLGPVALNLRVRTKVGAGLFTMCSPFCPRMPRILVFYVRCPTYRTTVRSNVFFFALCSVQFSTCKAFHLFGYISAPGTGARVTWYVAFPL